MVEACMNHMPSVHSTVHALFVGLGIAFVQQGVLILEKREATGLQRLSVLLVSAHHKMTEIVLSYITVRSVGWALRRGELDFL